MEQKIKDIAVITVPTEKIYFTRAPFSVVLT